MAVGPPGADPSRRRLLLGARGMGEWGPGAASRRRRRQPRPRGVDYDGRSVCVRPWRWWP